MFTIEKRALKWWNENIHIEKVNLRMYENTVRQSSFGYWTTWLGVRQGIGNIKVAFVDTNGLKGIQMSEFNNFEL